MTPWLVEQAPPRRYILCRPEGGLADMFNQIWLCYVYALRHDRLLVIDTVPTDFCDDLFRYFRPRTSRIAPFASVAADVGSCTVYPPQRARDGLEYERVWMPARPGKRFCFAPPAHRDLDLTLDFSRAYDEDLVVHHACGGGGHGGSGFRLFAPSAELIAEFRRRRALLPAEFSALHVRNTDAQSDFMPYVREHLAELALCSAVFVASDKRRTIRDIETAYSPPLAVRSFSQHLSDDGLAMHTRRGVDRHPVNCDAIVDLLLLSEAQRIYAPRTSGGGRSGYVRMAAQLREQNYASTLEPLVSCLMVTRGNLFPARFAIECFARQTYANRELVVLVDAPAAELVALIEKRDDPRIRVVHVDGQRHTLGALRNLAVQNARGDYVCQWDDDDLYAPQRIATQLDALLADGAAACVLSRLTLWWPAARRLALSGRRPWEGSILARKSALPAYPHLGRREDSEMMAALSQQEEVLELDAPELYVYIRHGGNTFGTEHYARIYHHGFRRWTGADYDPTLARLAKVLPIAEYVEALPSCGETPEAPAAAPALAPPLVSIVVRSMGRPELRFALESLARQDYPRLEVIVVNASGAPHPPLADLAWRPGHTVRIVGGERRLLRPHAANAGIDAVRGDWFGFLDDDDTCDPEHVSGLIRAAAADPEALIVYGQSRMLDAQDEVEALFGVGFNRAVMFYGPLFYWQAALIRRSALADGCRFDERLEVCEDRDFLAQVAALGEFAFVPSVTFNYRPDLGTSGTGRGPNRDSTRTVRFEQLLRAKWAGDGAYHTARSLLLCRRGMRAYGHGDMADAESWFRQALREYPDDPNALNGVGYLHLQAGALDEAESALERAVEINPAAGEYRINLAMTLERAGRPSAAREQAQAALADPSVRALAREHLARLGGPLPRRRVPARAESPAPSAATPTAVSSSAPARTALCPCGSGKRYKHCCGGRAAATPGPAPAEAVAARALTALAAGEAFAALDIVAGIAPAELTVAATALACADLCHQMQRHELAFAHFQQAARLGEGQRAEEALTLACLACVAWYKAERDAAMRRTLRWQMARLARRPVAANPPGPGSGPLAIVCDFGEDGDSAEHALAVHLALAGEVPARLWSLRAPLPKFTARGRIDVIDPAAACLPSGGHLLLVGTTFNYGDWIEQSAPARITVAFDTDLVDTLIARLVEIEASRTDAAVTLTVRSAHSLETLGVPADVEVPPVDVERFRPSRERASVGPALIVGRHGRDEAMSFHPNDPAFYHRLAGDGHQIRIAGGSHMASALAARGATAAVRLLQGGAANVVAFLDGLDCFVYRIHPLGCDAGGAALLQAMAMALPVVVIGAGVGSAELIESGRSGYVVDTEDEAAACIGALARDPQLRRALGAAARATVVSVMQRQRAAMIVRYARLAVAADAVAAR